LSNWLFDKKLIGKILEDAGFTTFSDIFALNSEFSLSNSYLQQVFNFNQVTQHQQHQSALYYRSPHSTITQSLSTTNVTWERENSGSNAQSTSQQQQQPQQAIGFRNSGVGQSSSTQRLNGADVGAEVRYSIDSTVQSNPDEQQLNGEDMDDDNTSYDSTSQISVDQYSESKFFLNGTNSTNSSTYNLLKQQAQQHNININDLSSFETLKRVLFNVSGNNNQSLANTTLTNGASGVGNLSAVASTVGAASSSMHRDNSRTGRFNVVHQTNVNALDQLDNNNRSSEENLKIINDFKQKPFDELKQTLMRSNQMHLNSEKYKQVVDLINKEFVAHPHESNSHHQHHHHNHHQRHHGAGASRSPSNLSLNVNENLKTNSNASFNNSYDSSNQSTSNLNNPNANSTNVNAIINQAKMIPLNDIEFPKLFMY